MKLDNLAIGKSAVIVSVGGTGALRQHFLDMGLIQGVEVTMVKYAPMGDPIEIKIHDFELTLRKEDAQKIEVKEITKKEELKNKVDRLISMSLGMVAKNIENLNLEFNKAIIDNIIYSGVYLRYKHILEEGCETNVQ